MLPQPATAPQSSRHRGVGVDTSRYGHYAAFLRDDLQAAADELQFAESAAGYALRRQRLQRIAQRHGPVHFVVRLDAAAQYADNLLHFLRRLANPLDADRDASARFALAERPNRDMPLSPELRAPRQVAGRLQAVVRQRTRPVNQFHHLLALAFPELALLTKHLAAGWVLELVHRFPTAQRLAQSMPTDLADIPYPPDARCGKKGDVIDLWAAVHGLSPRDAALDLVRTLGLEPAPRGGTEKRNG